MLFTKLLLPVSYSKDTALSSIGIWGTGIVKVKSALAILVNVSKLYTLLLPLPFYFRR